MELALRALGEFAPRLPGAQTVIPLLARDPKALARLTEVVRTLPTRQRIVRGDARRLAGVVDRSVHLVLTSPPYWTLKTYRSGEGQLGHIVDYQVFLQELQRAWEECYRVLVPGGRLVIVVGDVCLSRKANGRHVVVPLHAAIQEGCRRIGFDNLACIIWQKISNAKFEVDRGPGGFLGKPYEPNAIIKNDIEFLLMQRKGGGYRQPSLGMRLLSIIPEVEHKEWFQQVWDLPGASTRDHPAPYPLALAERLIRMFSFVGDTVLDPFLGTGTTCLAASRWGRNGIGFEVDRHYAEMARARLSAAAGESFTAAAVTLEEGDAGAARERPTGVAEGRRGAPYVTRKRSSGFAVAKRRR
ncbi:MAG: site-specific DNA-methyltransferase [Planctomycetes bacterium]|nr:site-specific DNA-methyltransferase [Planctomycetota bacterium]